MFVDDPESATTDWISAIKSLFTALVRRATAEVPAAAPEPPAPLIFTFDDLVEVDGDQTPGFDPAVDNHLLLTGPYVDWRLDLMAAKIAPGAAATWIIDPMAEMVPAGADPVPSNARVAHTPDEIAGLVELLLAETTARRRLLTAHHADHFSTLPEGVRPERAIVFISDWTRITGAVGDDMVLDKLGKVFRDARACGISFIIAGVVIDTRDVPGGTYLDLNSARLNAGWPGYNNPLAGFSRRGWNEIIKNNQGYPAIFEPAYGEPRALLWKIGVETGAVERSDSRADFGAGAVLTVGTADGEPVVFTHQWSCALMVVGTDAGARRAAMLDLAAGAVASGARVVALVGEDAGPYAEMQGVEVVTAERAKTFLAALLDEMAERRERIERSDSGTLPEDERPQPVLVLSDSIRDLDAGDVAILNNVLRYSADSAVTVVASRRPEASPVRQVTDRSTSLGILAVGPMSKSHIRTVFPAAWLDMPLAEGLEAGARVYLDSDASYVLDH
jgi:hypothetical protein